MQQCAFILKGKGANRASSAADDFYHQMMIHFLVAALFFHLSVCSAGDPCPPKHLLAPCTCNQMSLDQLLQMRLSQSAITVSPDVTSPIPRRKRETSVTTLPPIIGNDTFFTVVDCKVSKSIQSLEEIVSTALNRKLVDKLIVANVPPIKEHTLARLPSGWLKNVRVRQFEVLNSKLSGDFIWYGNPFEGQDKSLLWFSAHNCFLFGSLTYDTPGTVNTRGLNSLPYIQGLNFSNNLLTVITSPSFRYPPTNLSTVILSRNSIQSIEAGTFHYTPFLRHLDLSHNLLETIVRTIFASPARFLEHIDLSWNSLTTLTVDFFTNMPALKVVNASNNFLYSMPEKPWVLVWKQLTHIDVTGNFVACNCDLMWLLPILSPPEVNVTTTPAPKPLLGQTVLGTCSRTMEPRMFAVKYELVTLTRDRLVC